MDYSSLGTGYSTEYLEMAVLKNHPLIAHPSEIQGSIESADSNRETSDYSDAVQLDETDDSHDIIYFNGESTILTTAMTRAAPEPIPVHKTLDIATPEYNINDHGLLYDSLQGQHTLSPFYDTEPPMHQQMYVSLAEVWGTPPPIMEVQSPPSSPKEESDTTLHSGASEDGNNLHKIKRKPVCYSSSTGKAKGNRGRPVFTAAELEAKYGTVGNRKWECMVCCRLFTRNDHMRRHMSTSHGESKDAFACPVVGCYHTATRSDNLRSHVLSHHQDDIPEEYISSHPGKRGRGGKKH
ncbi:hypothetical protein BU17DRAFT_91122 [Hysterangium stoloniferum]|nr:hypothetical protein BU17DRAFT_91122 [Hysterangium stoloniferum]